MAKVGLVKVVSAVVARKVCYCGLLRGSVVPAKFPSMSLTRCLQSCVTDELELVLTRFVDPMTPHLWTVVRISQAKVCLHNIHVSSLFLPVLSLPVFVPNFFIVLDFTFRAERVELAPHQV